MVSSNWVKNVQNSKSTDVMFRIQDLSYKPSGFMVNLEFDVKSVKIDSNKLLSLFLKCWPTIVASF